MRNLELFQSTSPNGVALIDVLDQTLTAMGGRMLKHGLAFPERNLSVIEKRLDFVAALVKDTDAYDQMAHHLDAMVDIERIVAKIATQKISPVPWCNWPNHWMKLIRSILIYPTIQARC